MNIPVERAWGTYIVLEETKNYKIKRIVVQPEKALSVQLHYHRTEHWIVVSGTAIVEVNGTTTLLRTGESTYVSMGIKHRLINPGRIILEVIEIQLGQYLEEDDIVRFDT